MNRLPAMIDQQLARLRGAEGILMSTLYTSAGVIRDADRPRSGVTSNVCQDWLGDLLSDAVDLGHEELVAASVDDEELAYRIDVGDVETSGPYLIGDWRKDADGLYEPDTSGPNGFAALYSSESGCVITEWARATVWCNHTSPCYVMADGSGPCGDLDTPGNSVLAFALPPDAYYSEE